MSEMIELTEYELGQVSGGTLEDVYTVAAFVTVGAAAGFLIGGPPGAAVGATVGGMAGVLVTVGK